MEKRNQSGRAAQKEKRRKARKLKRRIFTLTGFLICFLLGILVGRRQMASGETSLNIASLFQKDEKEELAPVFAPVDYSYEEALARLEELVAEDERYTEILGKSSVYPEQLLINLANNPELLPFVANYPGDTATEEITLTREEQKSDCPLFQQWDMRWGYRSYGSSNISVSGCGPTALAMVIMGLTDEEVTPADIAEFSMDNGYYLDGTGTKWDLMTTGAEEYGLSSKVLSNDETQMKQALDNGAFLICSMAPGDFTVGGHFIVIYGYDHKGFKVNDPFCAYRSSIPWKYNKLSGQMKNLWALKKA